MFDYKKIGTERELSKPVDKLLETMVKTRILRTKEFDGLGTGYDFSEEFKNFTNPKVDEYGESTNSQFVFWRLVLIDYGIKYDLDDLAQMCAMTMVLKVRNQGRKV